MGQLCYFEVDEVRRVTDSLVSRPDPLLWSYQTQCSATFSPTLVDMTHAYHHLAPAFHIHYGLMLCNTTMPA